MVGKTLYWDVLRQLFEIKQGLVKAKAFGSIDCLSIDTWGVDFGLIDASGNLLENPVHCRDLRTQGIMEQVFQIVPRRELYQRTGIQFLNFNTLFQLFALKQQRPDLMERADKLLFMPDLLLYFLTGQKQTEYAIASTAQMLNSQTGDWDLELMERLGLPTRLLTPIVDAGTTGRALSPDICAELGIDPIKTVKPFRCMINPDESILSTPGNIPERIRQLCRDSGQQVPQTRGEVVRCIYESLALKYRIVKEGIEDTTNHRNTDLHIVGGGTKDGLLSQFTANATGSRVIAGPIEATALGNIAVQLIGIGALKSLQEARQIISASSELKQYLPLERDDWEAALKRYKQLFS